MPGLVLSSGDTKVNTTGAGSSDDCVMETQKQDAWRKNASASANTRYSDSKTKNTIPVGQKESEKKSDIWILKDR